MMTDRKDRIRVQIGGQEFSIVGGGFQEMLAAVKQISGRRFVSELKVWQLPGSVEQIQNQLDISGFRLEGGAPLTAQPQTAPASGSGGSDRVRVLVGGRRLAVVGGGFQEMLALVKSLPNRRFDSETKLWEISGDVGTIKGMIEAAGYQLEGAQNIPLGPPPPMEAPNFGPPSARMAPPSFEEPDFMDEADAPRFEPPDWWDDSLAPAPFEEEYIPEPPFFDSPSTQAPLTVLPSAPGAGKRSGDRIRVSLGGVSLVISGGGFQEMLAVVKNIPGRRFNPEERVWEIPDNLSLAALGQQVSAAGFTLEQE
jgi:hypothetical protein